MDVLKPGERIMLYRTRVGLSKKQLAERVGTSVATITKYEKGDCEFNQMLIASIATVLGVTTNRIYFGFDDYEKAKILEGLIKKSGIDE